MAQDPVDLAMQWDGLASLGPVWEELARRMGASERPVRQITVAGLDDRSRRKLASLLGLARVPEELVVILDVARIGSALGFEEPAQLRRLVERIRGPIGDRAAARAATSEARAALWALAAERLGTRVPNTLARIRAAGVPSGDVDAHVRVLQILADSLDRLPAECPVPLPMLAWLVSGDPHALDGNTTCGRYLQLMAVELAGSLPAGREPGGIRIRRALQDIGVILDRLSFTTITYGLRAQADSALGRVLEAGAAGNLPINVSGAMLDGTNPRFLQSTWLCVENPSVMEAAVLACHTGPLVCTSGWPSTDTQRLLDVARAQGVELRYAGDYDPMGLAIADFMARRHGARVIMSEQAYLAADMERAAPWKNADNVPSTPWAPELADAIRSKRRLVYQEDPAVWSDVLNWSREIEQGKDGASLAMDGMPHCSRSIGD